MKIILPEHIKLQIEERKISEHLVIKTLTNPEQTIESAKGRKIAQNKYFDGPKNKEYLLCVIFKEEQDCRVGITAYKTSKIKKYWR
ncbi:MAG: DUF4258 domain-containing protein [Elusimicrobiota bacterium]